MSAVENPIISNPYEEPTKHWVFEEKQPRLATERRQAGFFVARRTSSDNSAPVAAEQLILYDEQPGLAPVNQIRRRVNEWRKAGYPGTTQISRELLRHWNDPTRERKLFFCQKEAAETMIWLIEAPPSEKQGVIVPVDEPNDPKSLENGYGALKRYCPKMATGTGKTVVMAMLIGWSVLNKLFNKQDRRFSDAVLVICPNLTVKRQNAERLTPSNPKNFYEKFDLIPTSLMTYLSRGKYLITNWHLFLPEVDPRTGVIQRPDETDSAFCRRTLRELGDKQNILVLNDEAHHAHRPKPIVEKYQQIKLTADEQDELEEAIEEATVWVSALDKINKVRGVNYCVDLTATPFFIGGSGHPVGEPFPWIVSDFSLIDAIESGVCKIPRVIVDDNSGQPVPRYFRLWQWIMDRLSPADRAKKTRKPNPDAVLRQAEGALSMLASQWKGTLDTFNKYESRIPPVMIVVCNNTDLAETVHQHIAKGHILTELQNTDVNEFTIRIDSKLLAEAESQLDITARNSKLGKAEELREKVNTIGRIGEPGEQVRCVVSVSMLTEGWDAQNVTQILGLRRFDSQLLCEQVVGRGLRRTNYDDLSEPEYVDVYGVPFEVIPVKKASLTRPNPPQRLPTLVRALPERKALQIKFPRVEGYVYDIQRKVVANVEKIPVLYVSPANEPTEAIAKPASGVITERPTRLGPGLEKLETRDEYLKGHRLQTTVFEIASEVTRQLAPETRPFVFPQVLEITKRFVEKRVKVKPGASIDELALRRYSDPIISRLCDAIQPDVESGEAPLLPRIERHRESGSTSEVRFSTLKEAFATVKSHVSHVVTDSGWEHKIAYELDKPDNSVVAYVKNDHLDFIIPYEWEHEAHSYYPDFIVRLKLKDGSEVNVIVEVKGYEDEKDRAKKAAAQRWVAAVNHHAGFGRWDLRECKSQYVLPKVLENAKKQLEEKYCTETVTEQTP